MTKHRCTAAPTPLLRHHGLAAMAGVLLALAACTASSPSVSPSAVPTQGTPSQAGQPSGDAQPSDEPMPSGDGLEPFECDLPIADQATTRRANILDVRIGTHPGYDRVVFRFNTGTPEFTLGRAEPPFVQDGSGNPITVLGESFLSLTMRGGTRQMDDGTSSYDGPTEFHPDLPALTHLIEGGDFEAQSTWYFGLEHEACVRVLLLDDEPRLVIDLEHPDE